jgi:hypothetical protein
MSEREPRKETIGRGELYYLGHSGTSDMFSGYGLTQRAGSREFLVGLLMVDRPTPANPLWLMEIEEAFGEYQLMPMTATGERGIVCQMQIDAGSLEYLKRFPGSKSGAIREALGPLLDNPPKPSFVLSWDRLRRLWVSELAVIGQLPAEIREVFEHQGYGCLAAETNMGVVHICHAADRDIESFRNKPVLYQWQLINMPSAPLLRFEITIIDDPTNPYRFESFLNVEDEDQARVLAALGSQEELHFAFYGDDLNYEFTRSVPYDEPQWQQLDELIERALRHLKTIPLEERHFDRAKELFMRLHP